MERIVKAMDAALIKAQNAMTEKREAVDQIIIIFIIIAVAAGIIGLLYIYGTGTLLPAFENKVTTLVNGWFDHS